MQTARPIRAVFFCGLAPSSVLPITRWLAAGHEVAACVIASRQPRRYRRQENLRRWLVPEWSLTRVLARSQIPLIKAERTDLQSRLPDTMARFRADVLISDAFPYLIPSALTGVFPAGGVNLHPALLPHYRGPHPIQAMALDGAMETAGGVTLHCLSDRFDEGDIIAQLAISRSDAADMDALPMAMARAGAELLMTSLPRFCSGEIKPRPQTQALGRYARLMPEERVLTPDLTVEDVVLRAKVLGPFGVLIVDLGSATYKVAGLSSRVPLKPATGKPARVSPFTIEFDAANGRVRLLRRSRLLGVYHSLLTLRHLRRETRVHPTRQIP